MEKKYPRYITAGLSQQDTNYAPFSQDPFSQGLTRGPAEARAKRYDYALGQDSPGDDALFTEIMSGQEDSNKLMRAAEEKTNIATRRANLVRNYLQNKDRPLNSEDIDELYNLNKQELDKAEADPNLFYEDKFAYKLGEVLFADTEPAKTPEEKKKVTYDVESYNQVLRNSAIARKHLEDAYSQMDERTYGQAAKNFIPFWTWATIESVLEDRDEGATVNSIMGLGTNLRDHVERLYRLKPTEFNEKMKENIRKLHESDPGLAVHYANAVVGYAASDGALDDIFSLLDITTFGPGSVLAAGKLTASAAKGTVRGTSAAIDAGRLISVHSRAKALAKGANAKNIDYEALLPLEQQAHALAVNSLRRRAARTGQEVDWEALSRHTQSIVNPRQVLEGSDNMSKEAAARLEIALLRNARGNIEELISRPRGVNRLGAEELRVASQQAADLVDKIYASTTLGTRVVKLGTGNISARDIPANTDAISIYLGTSKADGFATEAAAKGFATKNNLTQAVVEPINGKFYVRLTEYVDETTPTLRAFASSNPKSALPKRTPWLHGFMSRVRMRDSLIPKQFAEDLKVAQAGTNMYFEANKKIFQNAFSGLNKKSRRDLDAFLERERDYRVEGDTFEDITRGRYSHTVGELNTNFSKEMGRPPTNKEIEAYFAWKQWNDTDYYVRNLDLMRDKVRLGIKQIQLRFSAETGEQWSVPLEGKPLTAFPWDRKGDAGVLIWEPYELHARSGEYRFRTNFASKKQREMVDNMIKDGYVVVQLSPYSKKDLTEMLSDLTPFQNVVRPRRESTFEEILESVKETRAMRERALRLDTPKTPKELKREAAEDVEEATRIQLYNKAEQSDSDVEYLFYETMARDDNFRKVVEAEGGIPQDIVEKANALVRYKAPKTPGGRIESGDESDIGKLTAAALRKGGYFESTDDFIGFSTNKTSNRLFRARDVEKKLNKFIEKYNNSAKAVDEPEPFAEFYRMSTKLSDEQSNLFEVHGVLGTTSGSREADFLNILDEGFKDNLSVGPVKPGTAGVDTTRSFGAPFLFISEPGKTLAETGPNYVVLNGPASNLKAYLSNRYPTRTFMTVNQANQFITKGKTPAGKQFEFPSVSVPAEKVSFEEIPFEEFSGGLDQSAYEGYRTFSIKIGDQEVAKTRVVQKGNVLEVDNIQSTVNNVDKAPKSEGIKGPNTLGRKTIKAFLEAVREQFPDVTHVEGLRVTGMRTAGKQGKEKELAAGQTKWKIPEPKKPETTKPQIVPDENAPRRSVDLGNFDYILVRPEKDMRLSNLPMKQIPYQEGGHKLVDDPWKITQARTHYHQQSGTTTYEGDVNAYSAILEEDARDVVTYLEQARRLLKEDLANGTEKLKDFYNNYLDGFSRDYKTFKNQFKEVNKRGHLSIDQPFLVTPRDQSSWNAIRALKNEDGTPLFPNLENQRDSFHNLFHNELNLQFALERGDNLQQIVRKGSKDQPIFGTQTQGNLSPMSTLINSHNQLIRGRMLDDLKIKTAEEFGRRFAGVIDAPAEEIARDPMNFILNPSWKTGLKGRDLELLQSAKDFRRALVDFLNVEDPVRDWFTTIQRTVGENIKRKLGQGSYEFADRHFIRAQAINPVRWLNNNVFDLFFGLFNIKQLAVQAMSSFHTAAVLGPINGMRAGFSAQFARWALFDKSPERLQLLARTVASVKLMKEDQFIEAVEAYRNSGWHIVGTTPAQHDDWAYQSIKPGKVERLREMGRTLFIEGDRFARGTGWMGAYIEWRAANPTAKLTPEISAQLLDRADTLTLNMSSASQAAMAKGVGNIPLKFTTYYLRVMEQLLPGWTGGPLTAKEKLMAYGMYSLMFGIPLTASGVVGVWPLHKEWKKFLIENGWEDDVDENMIAKALNDGVAELLPQLIGIDHTFSEHLGPSGSTWLYDIYNGRSQVFDIVTGVGGTKLEDTVSETWPFFTLIANAFRTDDKKYPLSFEDMELFARSISSVNNYWKSIQMYNTGIYMSKNRTPLAEVDGADAVTNLLFGTQPKELQEAFLKTELVRTSQQMKKAALPDIQRYNKLQMKAIIEGDMEAAKHYGKVISWLLQANGFRVDELGRVFNDTVTKHGTLVDMAERKFRESTPERQKMWLDSIKGREETE